MVDEEVVGDRLALINQYTNECKEMSDGSRTEYLEDVVLQRAVERSLMNAIQSCIDLASHIRASENLGTAETSREEIEALVEADIIAAETGSKLAEAVGFRNHLAHRYGDIDHDLVYDVLQEDLEWFDRFQQEVATWFQTR
ncbi:DUF86 family protein [Natrialba magadii ATCC 43099]|uniref:DUF86 family protein n=2 Tax=Natrialba TaxID=63742 RepID=D3SWD3_NATMM|nr:MULTISPECIES: DUF86 domain-containing protein [Natrialba]ADD03725.1 DUF86 family protein [Natrialba magadii ATCC 43099]ELY33780.1 hypothetical protein C500_01103 [Natrialba magadii ATCC 43099]ELY95657.1 hypothetical protein C483_00889 [Natrialba hulunbeirensis JCM 10989]OIB58848.1 hypothetical protein BBD46_06495 [Natrialba sp. SSL1]